MPDVYKAITENGHFVAFWKTDNFKLCMFLPTGTASQYYEENLSAWEMVRNSAIISPPESKSYNDTINAAHFFFAQYNFPIRREVAKLSSIEPGHYYPRIWRGHNSETIFETYNAINPRAIYGAKYVQSITAAVSLLQELVNAFRYLEPAAENFAAFGHRIRELLILTCTEIETAWRSVLKDNGYRSGSRPNTSDYVKLLPLMHLDEWGVALKDYPNIRPVFPFAHWSSPEPTRSLQWYDDYNAVKHDREVTFNKATFENLLHASAALHIMQAAQWGPEIFDVLHENQASPFRIVKYPKVDVSEIYVPATDRLNSVSPILFFS